MRLTFTRSLFITAILATFVSSAFAANVGYTIKVTSIGCELNNDTCWINISPSIDSGAGCSNKSQIRFKADTAAGRRMYNNMLLAFTMKKNVSIAVPDNKCVTASVATGTVYHVLQYATVK